MAQASKAWFAPKRFGYGAGLPIAWQGWVVLAVFIAGLAGAVAWLDGIVRVVAIVALVAGLFFVTRAKTEGGWRWRSGAGS